MIDAAIRRTEAGQDLSARESRPKAFEQIIGGRCGEEEIGQWLLALNKKGATVSEVAGAATALRRKMTPIRSSRRDLLDTCGTGGDGLRTFNISTAAALLTAAAGVPVAKHGNRAASSRSGSADVLAALGVNVEAGVAEVERCLDELGICFCFAPLLRRDAACRPHPCKVGRTDDLQHPRPADQSGRRAAATVGCRRPKLRMLLAESPGLLGTERSVVVHGSDGLDEVTLTGSTEVAEALTVRCDSSAGRLPTLD